MLQVLSLLGLATTAQSTQRKIPAYFESLPHRDTCGAVLLFQVLIKPLYHPLHKIELMGPFGEAVRLARV